MAKVYTDYFQKSKVFLYPLLGFRQGVKHVPQQTYIAWDNVYSLNSCRLLCEYKTKMDIGFKRFSLDYLQNHPLYEDHVELSNNKYLYIFNLESFKPDMERFIQGMFSQFSLDTKITILDFFGDQGKAAEYIHTFLTPDDGFEAYAYHLKVDIKTIEAIGELCSKPDLKKETLIDNNHTLHQLLKRSSISLTNK